MSESTQSAAVETRSTRPTQTATAYPNFREFLAEELARRCQSNPRYSLRAFARSLQLQSSYLSKVLRGERRATPKLVRRVAPHLKFTQELTEFYETQSKRKPSNFIAPQTKFQLLTADMFAAVSNWYHFAIMELTLLEGFREDTRWIASQLNIPADLVSPAIDRLKRLNLIEEVDGTIRCTGNFSNAVDPRVISRAQQIMQKELLSLAISAMDRFSPDERDQSSLTMAAPVALLPEIKSRIKNFRRELGSFVEKSDIKADRVYNFTVSLYPVSNTVTSLSKKDHA